MEGSKSDRRGTVNITKIRTAGVCELLLFFKRRDIMFLTDRKLERRIEELEAYRYRDRFSLECLQVMEDIQGKVNPVLPENFDGWKEMRVGDRWEGRDAYLWLRKKIKVPDAWKGKRITGIFDFGKTGAGNNSGFESMLYVDGEDVSGSRRKPQRGIF